MSKSIAHQLRERVADLSDRSFIEPRHVEGSRGAVESAFSRMAASGEILRVRKGLYWKGPSTTVGMARPRAEEVGCRLGGPGSGPAGASAAAWLGLTTQVPSVFTVATPTRSPAAWKGVKFTQRSFKRLLRGLSPTEVAVLEVLRAGPGVVEGPWARVSDVIADLFESDDLRVDLLAEQARDDHHRDTTSRWEELDLTEVSV